MIYQNRNWEQFHSPKNLSMCIAAEAPELMEHFLWIDGMVKNNSQFEKAYGRWAKDKNL